MKTTGSRIRRTATGFAALTIAALSGCHAVPVARIAPSPNRPQSALGSMSRAALFPATVAMEPPSEMSSIEPVSSASTSEPAPGRFETAGAGGDTFAPARPPAQPPAPTPLLDAALVKSRGVEAIVAEEIARSAPPPAPAPAPATRPDPAPAPEPDPPSTEPQPPAPSAEVPAPAPAPVDPPREARPAEPPRPEDAWRDGVRQLLGLAKARTAEPAGGSGPPWGLRARVLAWLAEPDIDPDLGAQESGSVRAVLRALDDAPAGSGRPGEDFRAAVRAIEDRAPLEIVELRLCSKVERFGDFEPFDPPVHRAGQKVVLYAEVDGLSHESTRDGFRTRLAAQLEILPEGGGTPIHTQSLGIAEETCRRRRRDYYVPYKLNLPRTLAPGDYRLRLTEKDLASDRSSTREVAFAIARD